MKRKREYTIYTIDARAMLGLCDKKDRRFDLTSEYDRSLIVESVKTYSESALFYQIRKAIREADGPDTPDAVTGKLVYLHFHNGVVDRNGVEDIKEELTELLAEGVWLRFRGDAEFHRFVPFDKSASMSRNNTISFISEDIFQKVNESLSLGLNWHYIPIEPSKYYAYRGLYMTDGIEIPPSMMELNERTVIVLDIDTISIHDRAVRLKYSDEEDEESFNADDSIIISSDRLKETGKFTSLPYDGEGIVCPNYARIINKAAVEDKQAEATSFQIRLPYAKGMLHTVDFHRFLAEQFPDEDINELELTDCFGIRRRISDARIILTRSMFKCAEWLKKFHAIPGGEPGEYSIDPMKYYFDAFHHYSHAMYLVGSDANFRSDDYVKLNYQFLNTLDLDKESFGRLVEQHIEDTRLITEDPYKGRAAILGTDEDEQEQIREEGDNELAGLDSWEYALKKNVAFINDPKINKLVRDAQAGQIRDIRRGRIVVPGTIKYLSGDLLYLLTIIAEKCGVADIARIDYLRKYRILYQDRFYLAGRQNYGLDDNKSYGILRSPHLSRNEQCALRPVKLPIYNKYFSQLKGVIMVSNKSSVPTALGGADFDGDTVKIIRDDVINNAIVRSVYERAKVTFETEEGPVERTVNRRNLPVVDIVPPDAPGRCIGERITYEDIRRAFSSNVGKISNIALTIAKLEYQGGAETYVPAGSTALCTIATGLEIDSVKTGIKPDTSGLEALAEDTNDTFLSIKSVFDRVAASSRDKDKAVHSVLDEKTGEYRAFLRYRTGKDKEKKLYSIGADQLHNVDMLPYYYARELAHKCRKGNASSDSGKSNIPEYRFRFEEDPGWENLTIQDPRLPALAKIIGSYRKIMIDAWRFSRTRERSRSESLRSSLVTLLNIEYDRDMDRLYRSGAALDDGLETAYEIVYNAMPLRINADEAINRMKGVEWQYIRTFEDKEIALKEIIGVDEIPLKALEILCDTYDNGYQFLNYILRDTVLFRETEERDADEAEYEVPTLQEIPKGKWNRDFDPDLYRKLHSDYRRTPENRNVWTRRAAATCRNAVYELFDGDMDEAIRCTLLLDGTHESYKGEAYDENHSFLWDVFTAGDMSKVVFAEEGGRDA